MVLGTLAFDGIGRYAFDNALAESFISTLKRELLHRHSWSSRERVRVGIFEYIECFYNPRRRLRDDDKE